MNTETINAIANRAAESIFIFRTEQEVYEMKQAMRKVAAVAIRDTEQIDCHGLEYYQNKYLSTLEEGAEKQAVERAFEAVLADFIKDK
jgi:hypothetical protein